jgi:cytoskeleton protein RodZ
MNFEELGDILRQERERRGLSVEDVANHLKLMPRVVRAIEQADVRELPQAAYARGFVKAYGNLLALDTALLYAGMDDAWPDDSHQPPASPYEPAEERKSGGKGRLVALITLMLLLAVAGWFWLARDLDFSLPAGLRLQDDAAVSIKSRLLSPPAQTRDTPPATGDSQPAIRQTSPPQAGSPAPVAAVTPAAPGQAASQAVPADNRRTENAPATSPQAEPVPAAPQETQRNLVITALADCWVHSTADNTDTRQFSLRKGDTFALTFSKQLVLKLGNAGGVKIRLDGRDLDPPGEAGQVKTLTFPAKP